MSPVGVVPTLAHHGQIGVHELSAYRRVSLVSRHTDKAQRGSLVDGLKADAVPGVIIAAQ
jgi:hypothetical protein